MPIFPDENIITSEMALYSAITDALSSKLGTHKTEEARSWS